MEREDGDVEEAGDAGTKLLAEAEDASVLGEEEGAAGGV
jgi:hypothetical protein